MGFSKSHFLRPLKKSKDTWNTVQLQSPSTLSRVRWGPACSCVLLLGFCLLLLGSCTLLLGSCLCWVLPAVALIGIISFGYALLEAESFFVVLYASRSWLGLLLGFCVLFSWDHFGGFVPCVAWVSFVVLYVSWLLFVPRLCIFRS